MPLKNHLTFYWWKWYSKIVIPFLRKIPTYCNKLEYPQTNKEKTTMASTVFHRISRLFNCGCHTMDKYKNMSTPDLIDLRKSIKADKSPIKLAVLTSIIVLLIVWFDNDKNDWFVPIFTNFILVYIFIEENQKKIKKIDKVLAGRV